MEKLLEELDPLVTSGFWPLYLPGKPTATTGTQAQKLPPAGLPRYSSPSCYLWETWRESLPLEGPTERELEEGKVHVGRKPSRMSFTNLPLGHGVTSVRDLMKGPHVTPSGTPSSEV